MRGGTLIFFDLRLIVKRRLRIHCVGAVERLFEPSPEGQSRGPETDLFHRITVREHEKFGETFGGWALPFNDSPVCVKGRSAMPILPRLTF